MFRNANNASHTRIAPQFNQLNFIRSFMTLRQFLNQIHGSIEFLVEVYHVFFVIRLMCYEYQSVAAGQWTYARGVLLILVALT